MISPTLHHQAEVIAVQTVVIEGAMTRIAEIGGLSAANHAGLTAFRKVARAAPAEQRKGWMG